MAVGVALLALRLDFPHSPDFLGSVVVFETTTVAITVPLFLSVAYKVFDEYGSRAVREMVFRDPSLSRLTVSTIVNSLLAIAAHAVFSFAPEWSSVWRLLSIVSLLNCVAVALLLLGYLRQLRNQVVNEPDWILDRMEAEALQALRGES
ncbi:MAG: hypothetical protein LLG08_00165 [Actinomycetia bacterium]|nr:hypothetical protein [Actinomycetes bacterium]